MFNSLIPDAINAGIRYFDFWDYTLYEITLHIEARAKRITEESKIQAQLDYSHAQLMTRGYAIVMGSKGTKFPSLYDAYPGLFSEQERLEAQRAQRLANIKKNMIEMANGRNNK